MPYSLGLHILMYHEMKNLVFTFEKYGKFWSISLEQCHFFLKSVILFFFFQKKKSHKKWPIVEAANYILISTKRILMPKNGNHTCLYSGCYIYYLLVYTVSIFNNFTRYLEQKKNYSDFCLVLSLALLVYYCDRTAV